MKRLHRSRKESKPRRFSYRTESYFVASGRQTLDASKATCRARGCPSTSYRRASAALIGSTEVLLAGWARYATYLGRRSPVTRGAKAEL